MKTFFSPAKVNLFFQVLGKRDDGFHEIASLYHAINLGDFLSFTLSSKDRITCNRKDIPLDDSNLVAKARNLFRQKTGKSFFLDVHLEKNVPAEAGLGGGSSNAATTLFALNELTDHPLSQRELFSLGAMIGSDVSFFFSKGAAMCRGRGEIFENVTLQKPFHATLLKPPFGMSTPQVYKALPLEYLEKRDPKKALQTFRSGNPVYFNDLEVSAFRLEPRLKTFQKELLKRGFETVSMTGSGTGFFCLGNPKTSIEDLKPQSIQGITRKSLNDWWTL